MCERHRRTPAASADRPIRSNSKPRGARPSDCAGDRRRSAPTGKNPVRVRWAPRRGKPVGAADRIPRIRAARRAESRSGKVGPEDVERFDCRAPWSPFVRLLRFRACSASLCRRSDHTATASASPRRLVRPDLLEILILDELREVGIAGDLASVLFVDAAVRVDVVSGTACRPLVGEFVAVDGFPMPCTRPNGALGQASPPPASLADLGTCLSRPYTGSPFAERGSRPARPRRPTGSAVTSPPLPRSAARRARRRSARWDRRPATTT